MTPDPASWIETLCEYANLNYYLQSQEENNMECHGYCILCGECDEKDV